MATRDRAKQAVRAIAAKAGNASQRLRNDAAGALDADRQAAVAYDPQLMPSLDRMRLEGIEVLEEWFRWGEEWSVYLRIFAEVGADTDVLEIGCGQGRIAFPLRYLLWGDGSYVGFDIDTDKIKFLVEHFQKAYPHFRFHHVDVRNTFYNPGGLYMPDCFAFPYENASFDVVFAASVFTHMEPSAVAQYFRESARVLRPGGRCRFSFFLFDYFDAERVRPQGFARHDFDFAHHVPEWGEDVAIAQPDNPEQMTAYRLSLLQRMADEAGLRFSREPIPGLWSGAARTPVGAQDLIVLHK